MLKQRVLTALVLAPLMLCATFLLPLFEFKLFIAAIVTLAAWEWANLSGYQESSQRVGYAVAVLGLVVLIKYLGFPALPILLAAFAFWGLALFWVCAYPKSLSQWQSCRARAVMGLFVLIPAWSGLVELKGLPEGNLWLLLLMLLVWGADIGAYFSGKTWGNKKLAVEVSPGKTWAGFYGGVATSLLAALLFGLFCSFTMVQLVSLLLLSLGTALVSVLGDLLESMVKRHRGIKDSSQLLPGHGGVMDRVDSLTAAAPIFALGLIMTELARITVV
ncbi:phosphatidate cytidylyltransferase [Motiliproteus coralliicola]|uniref:Phosphatidate cytidylyltransferase n=1 Tax=Motiliproteus coralliicola TaxID=2283196 RepID=A0A369WA19_9GAMM|nr:phosphatidate cytidylyltransferase [Motiliproteus coralliicola]RDE18517.1 phosphatidate cytidylyltransferase [Motiliproteus coralliicola]